MKQLTGWKEAGLGRPKYFHLHMEILPVPFFSLSLSGSVSAAFSSPVSISAFNLFCSKSLSSQPPRKHNNKVPLFPSDLEGRKQT